MKVVLCMVGILAVTQARDLSRIRHRYLEPENEYASNNNSRIIGGTPAKPNSYPHQAALFVTIEELQYFCEGSLISKNYVLTTAYCLDNASAVEVILGAHNLEEDEKSQVRMTSTEFVLHRGWNSVSFTNDIGVIKLPKSVRLSDKIKVISLPKYSDYDKSFAGEIATLSGWGSDSDGSTAILPKLHHINLEVIENEACESEYGGLIQSTNLCTSGAGNIGICSGDNGGPLIIDNKQIGIVSYTVRLGCDKGWPSVFTRVSKYLDWLDFYTDAEIS